MALDIKQIYPQKRCTLVHSRDRVMHKYHPGLHEIIAEECKKRGVNLQLGSRAKLPEKNFPITDGEKFEIELEDGTRIPANFAVS